MARPQEFDSEAAVDAALSVFWERGLHRASVDDLLTASNLSRSSLYNTFGGKDALFERAAMLYVEKQAACLEKTLSNPSLELALQKLFYSAINDNFNGRGCLLVKCASNLVSDEAAELPSLRQGFERMFSVVENRIRTAQDAKQIAKKIDPATAATLICANLSGLGVFQKAGMPKKKLKNAADLAVRALLQSMS